MVGWLDLPRVLFEGGDPFLLDEVPLALLVKQPEEVVAEILKERKAGERDQHHIIQHPNSCSGTLPTIRNISTCQGTVHPAYKANDLVQ